MRSLESDADFELNCKAMSSPKVFVLVPSYNHAPFVERCLRSIFRQTLPPAKMLVIDDGSRDDSVKIIKRTLADCPFPAQLLARENLGLCRTLNEGFSHSAGYEYFAYLGSDDVWLPRFLERRARQMQSNPHAVMAYGNAFLIDETDRVTDTSADWTAYKLGDDRKMLLSGIAPVSSSVFYRRSALEKVRWNEDARLEDYELYLKLSVTGEFVFDPEVHAAWRQHGYNTSGDILLMLREVLEALRRNAAILRLDAAQMKRVEQNVNFRYAEDVARRGLKKEAWQLALENWRGAEKPAVALGVLSRLLLPHAVLRFRRRLWQQRTAERFGRLEV